MGDQEWLYDGKCKKRGGWSAPIGWRGTTCYFTSIIDSFTHTKSCDILKTETIACKSNGVPCLL